MTTRLISVTPDAERTIAYCARVSSPNQDSEEWAPLLAYCVRNHHWSIFEMANMVVEITTSRAIAQQFLRHRSFSFQEHSQRYAPAENFIVYSARRQDSKNRQNSIDDLPVEDQLWFLHAQTEQGSEAFKLYKEALDRGIAKECARFLLPLGTETRLYMNGTLRSWIHYLQLRTTPGTQLEHLEIAEEIKGIFSKEFPAIAEALEW